MDELNALRAACAGCTGCGLAATRHSVVFGVGPCPSPVVFIGEGPGQQEDLRGEPFVGPAGQLLDDMLSIIDLGRHNCYICNIVKCRPPGNRDPQPQEQDACFGWLERQLRLLQPSIIVCLGRIAAMRLIRPDFRITREHGQWFERNGVRYLAMQGKKVLLIDADPQSDLTACLGWRDSDSLPQTLTNKLAAVMREESQDPFAGILSHEEKVDLVPSNLELSALEMSLVTAMSRESVMKNYLSQVKDNYDYVLIDCMPSLGMITLNALTAADSVIIPVQAQYLPAKGMTQLLSTIAKVKKHTNRNLTIDGILLTLVDGRTNLAKSTVEALRENFGCRIRIYRTTIPIAVKAAEVSSKGKSIYAYEPSSTVSKAYTDFTKEVLADGRQKERLHASHEHTR